jgi:hypothetical protein
MASLLRNQWLVLAGLIILCLAVGSLGGFATRDAVDGCRVGGKHGYRVGARQKQ